MDNEEKREEIRREIKRDARNLCTYVVNTCVEYKEELLRLEEDIRRLETEKRKLEKKNQKLKRDMRNNNDILTNLREENLLLYIEYENSQTRIRNMIERFGANNMCYNCDHFVDCGDTYLCVYCQKWVCKCCINPCVNDNSCSILICSSCQQTHPKCPQHKSDKYSEDLMEYYTYHK